MAPLQHITLFRRSFNRGYLLALMSTQCKDSIRTAGIIVIGDEILKGQVVDTNTNFLTQRLYKMGIKVSKISVLPDIVEEISSEVQNFSSKFTYVLTTGGIGPTHDDLTYEAVAHAFGVPLEVNEEIVKILSGCYKDHPTGTMPGMKLANVPKTSTLTFGLDNTTGLKCKFPNVSIKNVYMFPGIPKLLESLFTSIAQVEFGGSSVKFYYKEIYLNIPEVDLVNKLNTVVKKFSKVTFGSYPDIVHRYYRVKITIESMDEALTDKAYETLQDNFEGSIVQYDPEPLINASTKVDRIMKKAPEYVINSYRTLSNIIKNESGICLWFDGQIASTALMHLCYACQTNANQKNVLFLYYRDDSSDTGEHENYISETQIRYKIQVKRLENMDKEYLNVILKGKTLLTGQNLGLAPNTGFKVLNLMQEWTKDDVWFFVRGLTLPYSHAYK